MKNGIPFDVAFGIDDTTSAACAIVFSEFEGHKFDFRSMQWRD